MMVHTQLVILLLALAAVEAGTKAYPNQPLTTIRRNKNVTMEENEMSFNSTIAGYHRINQTVGIQKKRESASRSRPTSQPNHIKSLLQDLLSSKSQELLSNTTNQNFQSSMNKPSMIFNTRDMEIGMGTGLPLGVLLISIISAILWLKNRLLLIQGRRVELSPDLELS